MNFGPFDLNGIWFVLIGVLFTGYAMLDGFDLGVGALVTAEVVGSDGVDLAAVARGLVR